MIKVRKFGKYVGQKQGINKEYELVAVSANGSRTILPVQADSKSDAVKEAKARGFKEVVKGSVWRKEEFETRRGLGANVQTTEAGWKTINDRVKRRKEKQK